MAIYKVKEYSCTLGRHAYTNKEQIDKYGWLWKRCGRVAGQVGLHEYVPITDASAKMYRFYNSEVEKVA